MTFWDYVKSYSSSSFYPQVLAHFSTFLAWITHYYDGNGVFSNTLVPSTFISWFPLLGKNFLFPFINLFIHLFISVWTHGFLCYSTCCNSFSDYYLFWCSHCPSLANGSPYICGLLACPHHSLTISLLTVTKRCSRLILCFVWPSPGESEIYIFIYSLSF